MPLVKKKLRRQWKITFHTINGEVTLILGTVTLPHQTKEEKISMRIRRVAGLAWNRLLMGVGNGTGKGTSGMDPRWNLFCRTQ
jgi:hypothetical protein